MKTHKILLLLCSFLVIFTACDDDDKGRNSIPVIESVTLSHTESITLSETLTFDAKVVDPATPLSTLEVELYNGEELLDSRSIRTKGNEVNLTGEEMVVPFLPNIETGDELLLRFTLINVDGHEAVVEKSIKAKRPELPEILYMVVDEDNVIELRRSADDPYLYASAEDQFKNRFAFTLATSEDLEAASFIWNGSGQVNEAVIGERFGENINLAYPTWIVSQITFNALTFEFAVDGENIQIYMKNTLFTGEGNYFYARINFTQGEEFTIEGLDNTKLAAAYNRDFFDYDADSGVFTFLRASGTWDIYYFMDVNYFWVMRLDDVAPACYWIVGHGFTCATTWNEDYYAWDGWYTDVPHCLGYVVPIGNSQYQVSMYLDNDHAWGSFEFEIYSDREWSKDKGILLTDASLTGTVPPGFSISGSGGLTSPSGSDFVPGYYRFIFDTSAGTGEGKTTVSIEKILD